MPSPSINPNFKTQLPLFLTHQIQTIFVVILVEYIACRRFRNVNEVASLLFPNLNIYIFPYFRNPLFLFPFSYSLHFFQPHSTATNIPLSLSRDREKIQHRRVKLIILPACQFFCTSFQVGSWTQSMLCTKYLVDKYPYGFMYNLRLLKRLFSQKLQRVNLKQYKLVLTEINYQKNILFKWNQHSTKRIIIDYISEGYANGHKTDAKRRNALHRDASRRHLTQINLRMALKTTTERLGIPSDTTSQSRRQASWHVSSQRLKERHIHRSWASESPWWRRQNVFLLTLLWIKHRINFSFTLSVLHVLRISFSLMLSHGYQTKINIMMFLSNHTNLLCSLASWDLSFYPA